MKILKVNSKNMKESVVTALGVVKNGGVIIYPTETVYGLGCDVLNEKALARLFQVKKRDPKKPILILVSGFQMAKKVALFDKRSEKIFFRILGKAISVVLYKKGGVSDALTGGQNKIALRTANHIFPKLLLRKLSEPITSTSANISGKPASGRIKEVLKQFKNRKSKPDLVLDFGDLPKSQSSTILDLTVNPPKILRQGAVSKETITRIVN